MLSFSSLRKYLLIAKERSTLCVKVVVFEKGKMCIRGRISGEFYWTLYVNANWGISKMVQSTYQLTLNCQYVTPHYLTITSISIFQCRWVKSLAPFCLLLQNPFLFSLSRFICWISSENTNLKLWPTFSFSFSTWVFGLQCLEWAK